jgi:hypothetical protein
MKGVWKAFLDLHPDVFFIGKGRAKMKCPCLFETETASDPSEVFLGRTHGGTHEDGPRNLLKKVFSQDFIDTDGSGVKGDSPLFPLDPPDFIVTCIVGKMLTDLNESLELVGSGCPFHLDVDVFHQTCPVLHLFSKVLKSGSKLEVNCLIRMEANFFVSPEGFGKTDLERSPPVVCKVVEVFNAGSKIPSLTLGKQSSLPSTVPKSAEVPVNPPRREPESHCIGRNVFEVMGFVKHDHGIVREELYALATEREICKEEGVVDDDNTRVLESAAPALKMTGFKVGTVSPQAVAMFCLNLLPDFGLREKGEGASCPIPSGSDGMLLDPPKLISILEIGEEVATVPNAPVHAPETEVVVAAKSNGPGKFHR